METAPATGSPGTKVPVAALYHPCSAGQVPAMQELSEALAKAGMQVPLTIGQDRAVEAIEFGIGIRSKGFNIFVLGPTGVGRHTLIRDLLEQISPQRSRSDDRCYINNFVEPHQPMILRLPAGRATELRDAMA